MYFRGGSAPSNIKSRNVTAANSPVMIDSKRPLTAAGEKSELTDINLALRFNRQLNVHEDDEFDILSSQAPSDDAHGLEDGPYDSRIFTAERRESTGAMALNEAVKAAIKNNMMRDAGVQKEQRPEGRAENRKAGAKVNGSVPSRPSSTKESLGGVRAREPRAQSASMLSAAATYGSTSKARFTTSMKSKKALSPYISASSQSSPYIQRSSSAKTASKPRDDRGKRTGADHAAQPTVSSSEKVKEAAKEAARPVKAINGSAATLLATTKTKHPSILLRAFSAHTDSDALTPDSPTPSSSQLSTPGRNNAEAGYTDFDLVMPQSSRSTESAEAHREEPHPMTRAHDRRAAATKDMHISASLGALDGSGRSSSRQRREKARPKSRKLYLGVDQDDCSYSSEEMNMRRSASCDMLETSYEDLQRPPSRQKVAAQHLFENATSEPEGPPLELDILKPELQPRARSANATISSDVFVTHTQRESLSSQPRTGTNDPFADGFEELEVPCSPKGPFRTIVSSSALKLSCLYSWFR